MTQLMSPPVGLSTCTPSSCLVRESLPWILAQFGKSESFHRHRTFWSYQWHHFGSSQTIFLPEREMDFAHWLGSPSVGVLAGVVSGVVPWDCLSTHQTKYLLFFLFHWASKARHPHGFHSRNQNPHPFLWIMTLLICSLTTVDVFGTVVSKDEEAPSDCTSCKVLSCLDSTSKIWSSKLLYLKQFYQRSLSLLASSTEDVMVTEEWKLACLVSVWVLLSSPEKKDWEGTFSYGLKWLEAYRFHPSLLGLDNRTSKDDLSVWVVMSESWMEQSSGKLSKAWLLLWLPFL